MGFVGFLQILKFRWYKNPTFFCTAWDFLIQFHELFKISLNLSQLRQNRIELLYVDINLLIYAQKINIQINLCKNRL